MMFENKNVHDSNMAKYMYSQEEMDDFIEYIDKNVGHVENVFHEIVSDSVHLDVLIVKPDEKWDCYKLITMGAGAYQMNFPAQVNASMPRRVEYAMCLPKNWQISNMDEEYYWPIRYLKTIARMPSQYNDWFAPGHTIQANEDFLPFHKSTKLNGIGMLPFNDRDGHAAFFKTTSGKQIAFLQMLPLYDAELRYAMEFGMGKLMEKMDEDVMVPKDTMERKNYGLK